MLKLVDASDDKVTREGVIPTYPPGRRVGNIKYEGKAELDN